MKRLTLKSETLTTLTDGDLAAVHGGTVVVTIDQCPVSGAYPTIPVRWCLQNKAG